MKPRPLSLLALLLCTAAVHAQPPQTPKPAELKIEPTFIDLPETTFAGVATYAGPGSPRFPELWNEGFSNVMKGAEGEAKAQYGLEIEKYVYGLELFSLAFDKDPKRNFTYMACHTVQDTRKVPLHLLQRTVPAARYAAFRVPDGLKGLGATFNYIYTKWLPASPFSRAYPFDMERYDLTNAEAKDGNFVIDILVPIAPRK